MAKKVKTIEKPKPPEVQHTAAPVYFVADTIEYVIAKKQLVFGDAKGRTHTVTLSQHGHGQWVWHTTGRH